MVEVLRITRGAAVATVFFLLAGCAGSGDRVDPVPADLPPGTIAIVNADVASMVGDEILEDRTIIVSDGRIEWIGLADRDDLPEDVQVIEGAGRTLVPGLGEMHAHVPPNAGREEMERVMFLYLSQGITTVRGMLGQPAHLQLREDVAAGQVLGPRLYTTGPSLNGNSIPTPDSAARAVRFQHEAGYDLLKIHPGLTREAYDSIAATATQLGIPWAGHVPAAVGLARALETGQASIDHLDQYVEASVTEGTDTSNSVFFGLNLVGAVDEARLDSVARATAEAGVWNVPTQSLIENIALPVPAEEIAARPEMRYWPPDQVRSWVDAKRNFVAADWYSPELAREAVEVRRRLIKALQDAGAGLLLGSDAPQVFQIPGYSIHQELDIMVAAGLTPYEALRAGTYNVADYFGTLSDAGTIEPGKWADLVLVEGNPLADITALRDIVGVMAAGRWVDREEIDRRLEAMADRFAGAADAN